MATDTVRKGLDQRRANYRVASDLASSCAQCVNYDGEGWCHVVAGSIRPDYVSDGFVAVGSPEAQAAMDTTVPDAVFILSSDIALSANDDQQLVFGWANVALAADGTEVVDSHGDSIDPTDLEDAAYEFVLNYGLTGDQHEGSVTGRLVESFYLTAEKASAFGMTGADLPVSGWWVGFHIEDRDTYDLVKSGERPMFSIQGRAVVEEV